MQKRTNVAAVWPLERTSPTSLACVHAMSWSLHELEIHDARTIKHHSHDRGPLSCDGVRGTDGVVAWSNMRYQQWLTWISRHQYGVKFECKIELAGSTMEMQDAIYPSAEMA